MNRLVFVCFLLIANPIVICDEFRDENVCGDVTCRRSTKFNYEIGKSYEYRYETNILSVLEDSRNESEIAIRMLVEFRLRTECEGELIVRNLSLAKHNPDALDAKKYDLLRSAIETHTLRFSFDDGRIDEICPHENELNVIVNVKKSILSLFQNRMKRFDIDHRSFDRDINGVCETDYRFLGANRSTILIRRQKNFFNCRRGRFRIESSIESEPYSYSNLQNPNIIPATSECLFVINRNRYEQIDCFEEHQFKPFMNRSIGIKMQIAQKLWLVEGDDVAPSAGSVADRDRNNDTLREPPVSNPIKKRSDLLYDHRPIVEEAIENLKSTRDLLKKMCHFKIHDQSTYSDLFSQFIHLARLLSYTSLNQLFLRSEIICENGKEIFFDTLPFIANQPAIAIMNDLISSRAVKANKIREWYLTLAMTAKPQEKYLSYFADLLLKRSNDSYVRLAIAAMIHNYCKHNRKCANQKDIVAMIVFFENNLRVLKQADLSLYETKRDILVNLKCFGNIGIVRDEFVPELKEIIENARFAISVRLAAIQAFRRVACEPYRAYFIDIYRDAITDSELRIAAYLQILKCPTYATIKLIKYTLEHEEINQVGAFVWSHLHNLLKSSSPNKIYVQSLLSDDDLERKFSNDFRKFSRNFKQSYYFDEINSGFSLSSNLIFGTKSYVPKSLMVNLTSYIFGESVNIFQFDTRLNGFENWIESIFAPLYKYFSGTKPILDALTKYRFKRDDNSPETNSLTAIAAEPNRTHSIRDRIDNLNYRPASELDRAQELFFSLAVYGNDLVFESVNFRNDAATATATETDHNDQSVFEWRSILMKLFSKQAIEFRKTILFLDFNYVSSTSVGFPIVLEGLGTSSTDLRFFQNFQTNFTNGNWQSFHLLYDSSFNFSLNFNGKIFMDMVFAKTGVKLKANGFTTMSFYNNLTYENGQLFLANFSFPLKKTEFVNLKSEFYVIRNDRELLWHDNSENAIEKNLCSLPFFDRIVGLKFCSNLRFPNVSRIQNRNRTFLISPIALRFYLERTDDTIDSYEIQFRNSTNLMRILFRTIGEKIENIFEANMTGDSATNRTEFSAVIKSRSFGLLTIRGLLQNRDREKFIDLVFDINDQQYFNSSAILLRKETKHGYTLYPNFYVKVKGDSVAEGNGSIKLASKKGISQYDINLAFQTKKVKIKLVSYVTSTETTLSTTLKLNYMIRNQTPEFVYMELKVTNRSTKSLTAIGGNLKLETSAYSHLDFDVMLTFQRTLGHIEFKIESNPETISDVRKLNFLVLYNHYRNPDSNKLNMIFGLAKPESELDLRLQLKHEMIGSEMNSLFLVRYAKNRDILVSLHLSVPEGILFYMDGKLNVTLPTFNSMIVEGTINEKETYNYDIELKSVWFSGHNIYLRGVYEDKSSDFESDHRLKCLIKSKSFSDVTTFVYYYRDQMQTKLESKAKYENVSYNFDLKHIVLDPLKTQISAELKYDTKIYTISCFMNFTEKKTIEIDLHIDRMRDVQLYLKSYSTNKRKEYGIEMKWDANRDPKEKFIALFELDHPLKTKHNAIFFLSYPGRTINSFIDLEMFDYFNMNLNSRLSWSSRHAVQFQLNFMNNFYNLTNSFYLIEINSSLSTPFANWSHASYSGRFFSERNLIDFHSNLQWKSDEQIVIVYLSNTDRTEYGVIHQFNCIINSTFPKYSLLMIMFDQNYNNSGLFSNLYFKYGANKSFLVRSIWEIIEEKSTVTAVSTLTGTVFLTTNFNEEKTGLLTTKIHYIDDGLLIDCIGHFNYDNGKFVVVYEGNFEKILHNYFYVNVSTPFDKYENIEFRFGIDEKQRHVFAQLSNFNETIGFEVKLFFIKLSDFDIKLSLALPTDYFKKLLLIAKIKEDHIDFQFGWNAILVGMTGISRFDSALSFEYMYKIYIPFEKIEQVGFTLKLLSKKEIDFEVYIYLVYKKLGLKIKAKPKHLKSDEIERSNHVQLIKFNEGLLFLKNDSVDYSIKVQADFVILPTIYGLFDFHKHNFVNVLNGHFQLPKGNVEIFDRFDFNNLFSMSNQLIVKSPFARLAQLSMYYNIDIVLNRKYMLSTNFMFRKPNDSLAEQLSGNFLLDYRLQKPPNETDFESHSLEFEMHTPFENIPPIRLETLFEFEENLLAANCSLRTRNLQTSLELQTEIDEGFVENSLKMQIESPIFQIYDLHFNLRKEYSPNENKTDLLLQYYLRPDRDFYQFETKFYRLNTTASNCYYFAAKLQTPVDLFRDLHAIVNSTNRKQVSTAATATEPINLLQTHFAYNSDLFFNITSQLHANQIDIDIVQIRENNDYSVIQLKSQFEHRNHDSILFVGKLILQNFREYRIYGFLQFESETAAGKKDGEDDDNDETDDSDENGDEGLIIGRKYRRRFVESIEFRSDPQDIKFQANITKTGNLIRIKTSAEYFKKTISFDSDIDYFAKLQWFSNSTIKVTKPLMISKIVNNFYRLPTPYDTGNNLNVDFDVVNNFEQSKIGNSFLKSYLKTDKTNGNVSIIFASPNWRINMKMNWIWDLFEKIFVNFRNDFNHNKTLMNTKMIFNYDNPRHEFSDLNFGLNLTLRDNWRLISNNTFRCPDSKNLSTIIRLELPAPIAEDYLFNASLVLDTITNYFVQLDAKMSQEKFRAFGRTEIDAHLISSNNTIRFGSLASEEIDEVFQLRKSLQFIELLTLLKSPYFEQGRIFTKLTFADETQSYSNLITTIFYPNESKIFYNNIDYRGFSDLRGQFNVTVPPDFAHFFGSNYSFRNEKFAKNFNVRVFWTNDSAVLRSKHNLVSVQNESYVTGGVVFEFPLTSRHYSNISYEYKENSSRIKGNATIFYNETKILVGNYESDLRTVADDPNYDRNNVQIELLNDFFPLGINYRHKYPKNFTNLTIDTKGLHLFHLLNLTKFNISSEIVNELEANGQKSRLTVTAKNRTVVLLTDYVTLSDQFWQNIELNFVHSKSWIGCDFQIINKTLGNESEARYFYFKLYYPIRNFTLNSSYHIYTYNVSSESLLQWTNRNDRNSIGSSFYFIENEKKPIQKRVLFNIYHPSLHKNISFEAELYRNYSKLIDVFAGLVYSTNENKNLKIFLDIDNHKLFNCKLNVSHPATNLLIKIDGQLRLKLRHYLFNNYAEYKRTYLPKQIGEFITEIDLNNYRVLLQKKTLRDLVHFFVDYERNAAEGVHESHLSFIYGPEINASGHLLIDFVRKNLDFVLNKTADGSKSLHLLGRIPDVRSGRLQLYRNYDGIDAVDGVTGAAGGSGGGGSGSSLTIHDIAFFVKLNHSRFILTKLNWRPQLRHDIRRLVKTVFATMYENLLENADYWRHYIRSESVESLNDIWLDAKPIIRDLLDDFKSLKSIENDFVEFRRFFNVSYNANEFYIKDIIDMSIQVLNELSKRSKLKNLPAVFIEIWEVLGESGDVIRRSILWLIDTTKNSYRKVMELAEMILKGDILTNMSALFEKLIHKYDVFIKDLHVSVLTFIENILNQFYHLFVDRWNSILKAIEPTFLKVAHYVETIFYTTSKQFLDYLYKRRSEIIESKYFNQFAKFAKDIDRFYRDFMSDNILNNISKYSKALFSFLQDKYYQLIPFAKELSNIGTEIYNEIALLQKLPAIQYFLEKYREIHEHFLWIFNYFDVTNKTSDFLNFLRLKFSEISLSALESENKHRKAKTKFVYDLENGYLDWEQKLPISWPAFNESPKFQEIPEYKFIVNLQNYLLWPNRTFWSIYSKVKYLIEPSEILPPFKAYAAVIGRDGFITFDRKYFKFRGNCEYLLANDFHNRLFSLGMTFANRSTVYSIVFDNELIEFDMFNKRLSFANNSLLKLPYRSNRTFIYQKSETITIANRVGVVFRCNIKFQTCLLELSGWFFGKTAGLLGTMNNEPFDDFYPLSAPNWHPASGTDDNGNDDDERDDKNAVSGSLMNFTKFWHLDAASCDSQQLADTRTRVEQFNRTISGVCNSLFTNRLSQFQSCLSLIDPSPYFTACLQSTDTTTMCSALMSYIEICAIENTFLKLPSICVQCELVNKTLVYEGSFVRLQGKNVPKSADIVFIAEAKPCNRNIRLNRNIDSLVNNLNRELANLNIVSNRYSLIVYGDNEMLVSEPRAIVLNNEIFANHSTIPYYFDDFAVSNGSFGLANSFLAMNFASKLIFRAGVKKIFILMPCSICDNYKVNLNFNVVNQLMFDNDITLHILINDEFQTDKVRIRKSLFGIDKNYAYTRKDAKVLAGDREIRNEIKLKPIYLNYCSSLAFESKGSIFSAVKLEQNKKFPVVFAKRVAVGAFPANCQTCECVSDDHGIPYMECYSCNYQIPIISDFELDADDLQMVEP